MDCKEMFDLVCSDRFNQTDKKLDKIFNRLFVTNGDRSVIDRLDDNANDLRRHIEDTALVIPAVETPFNPPKLPEKTMKMKVGKLFSIEGGTFWNVLKVGSAMSIILLQLGIIYILLKKFGG